MHFKYTYAYVSWNVIQLQMLLMCMTDCAVASAKSMYRHSYGNVYV